MRRQRLIIIPLLLAAFFIFRVNQSIRPGGTSYSSSETHPNDSSDPSGHFTPTQMASHLVDERTVGPTTRQPSHRDSLLSRLLYGEIDDGKSPTSGRGGVTTPFELPAVLMFNDDTQRFEWATWTSADGDAQKSEPSDRHMRVRPLAQGSNGGQPAITLLKRCAFSGKLPCTLLRRLCFSNININNASNQPRRCIDRREFFGYASYASSSPDNSSSPSTLLLKVRNEVVQNRRYVLHPMPFYYDVPITTLPGRRRSRQFSLTLAEDAAVATTVPVFPVALLYLHELRYQSNIAHVMYRLIALVASVVEVQRLHRTPMDPQANTTMGASNSLAGLQHEPPHVPPTRPLLPLRLALLVVKDNSCTAFNQFFHPLLLLVAKHLKVTLSLLPHEPPQNFTRPRQYYYNLSSTAVGDGSAPSPALQPLPPSVYCYDNVILLNTLPYFNQDLADPSYRAASHIIFTALSMGWHLDTGPPSKAGADDSTTNETKGVPPLVVSRLIMNVLRHHKDPMFDANLGTADTRRVKPLLSMLLVQRHQGRRLQNLGDLVTAIIKELEHHCGGNRSAGLGCLLPQSGNDTARRLVYAPWIDVVVATPRPGHSLAEQARLFYHSDIVVATHGAAMAWAALLRPGGMDDYEYHHKDHVDPYHGPPAVTDSDLPPPLLVEIVPPAMTNMLAPLKPVFAGLVQAKQLRHHIIHCRRKYEHRTSTTADYALTQQEMSQISTCAVEHGLTIIRARAARTAAGVGKQSQDY